MMEKRTRSERRCEPRYPLAGTLRWRKTGGDRTLVGWLSDTSRSSMSFITSRASQPSFGERIEMIGSDRSACPFRVTRTAAYDESLSLVACRRLAPTPNGTDTGEGRRRGCGQGATGPDAIGS
jgi:hypothetical protein